MTQESIAIVPFTASSNGILCVRINILAAIANEPDFEEPIQDPAFQAQFCSGATEISSLITALFSIKPNYPGLVSIYRITGCGQSYDLYDLILIPANCNKRIIIYSLITLTFRGANAHYNDQTPFQFHLFFIFVWTI